MRRLTTAALAAGLLLFASGAGMRAYASWTQHTTETRLLAARPASVSASPSLSVAAFGPADGDPVEVRLPALGWWNRLAPVVPKKSWDTGQLSLAWDVRDGGWHAPTRPGFGLNVVLAGHSPSLDPSIWPRSVFRQLAYLAPGERIEVTAGSRVYEYAVSRVFAIPAAEADSENAAQWIEPGDRERLTLVTCWPPQNAAYRVIATADPLEVKERTYHEP